MCVRAQDKTLRSHSLLYIFVHYQRFNSLYDSLETLTTLLLCQHSNAVILTLEAACIFVTHLCSRNKVCPE